MNREEILKRLGRVLEESMDDLDWSSVTEETTLESFGFDSLAVLDLIFDLEQELGVEISAAEILRMKTTGDLVTFVEEKIPS